MSKRITLILVTIAKDDYGQSESALFLLVYEAKLFLMEKILIR